MGLAIHVSNLKFLASPVPKIWHRCHWVGARGGVPKLARGSPSFVTGPHQIWRRYRLVEWSMLNANVLYFRYIFALSNYGANCLRLGTKNCSFSAPVRFRGTSKKIGIANVLLGTKPRRVGKFRGCRFCDLWESVARKKTPQIIMLALLSLR